MTSVTKKDEVYLEVRTEQSTARALADFFTFEVPGAKFMPSYRKRYWDGKIRLYDSRKSRIYAGLYSKMRQFATDNGYDIDIDERLEQTDEISIAEAKAFIKTLNLPVEPRDYQIRAF